MRRWRMSVRVWPRTPLVRGNPGRSARPGIAGHDPATQTTSMPLSSMVEHRALNAEAPDRYREGLPIRPDGRSVMLPPAKRSQVGSIPALASRSCPRSSTERASGFYPEDAGSNPAVGSNSALGSASTASIGRNFEFRRHGEFSGRGCRRRLLTGWCRKAWGSCPQLSATRA